MTQLHEALDERGRYGLPLPPGATTAAVQIMDPRGEELLIVAEV